MFAAPQPAEAMPRAFAKDPQTTQNGITYVLHKRYAMVSKAPNRKSVTIPDSVTYRGKRYTVSAIWSDPISKAPNIKRLTLKAKHLETIEDPAVFDRKSMEVICYDRATYAWLHRYNPRAKLRK